MSKHITRTAGKGLKFPYAGVIIGHLVDGLGLRQWLRESKHDGASERTIRTYLRGGDVRDRDAIARIINIISAELMSDRPEVHATGVELALGSFVVCWDEMISTVNANGFELTSTREQCLAVARLYAFEVGLRWGALGVVPLTLGRTGDSRIPWLLVNAAPGCFGAFINVLRANGVDLARHGISPQTLHNWTTGNNLPSSDGLENLASVLSDGDPERHARELIFLRVARAVDHLSTLLHQTVGDQLFSLIVQTASDTCHLCFNAIRDIEPMVHEARRPDLFEDTMGVAMYGGAHHLARRIVEDAVASIPDAKSSMRDDLHALVHPDREHRAARLQHWMQTINGHREGIDSLDESTLRDSLRSLGVNVSSFQGSLLEMVRRESDTLAYIYPFGSLYNVDERIDPAAFVKAEDMEELQFELAITDAGSLIQQRRFQEALDVLEPLLRTHSNKAYLHFRLGVAHSGLMLLPPMGMVDIERYRLAQHHIEESIRLAPTEGIFLNELGIVHHNARMFDRAEEAYRRARPYCDEVVHYWYSHGRNHIVLGANEEARGCLERAIELQDGDHIEAMTFLSMLLMELGERRAGRNMGRRVARRTGVDPTDDYQRFLRDYRNSAR